jgi:iron-sulfur cluster repair protein YtfE (RIC family)
MNAAAIQAALNTVEQDHRLVLDKMQALKEAVGGLLDPGAAPRRVIGRLHELYRFFLTQFLTHIDEEEVTLFPLLAEDAPDGAGLVARLREEHTAIRRRLDEFGNCLEVAASLDEPPRAVLRDLFTYGWDFWEMLAEHAYAESRGVRNCLLRSFAAETR